MDRFVIKITSEQHSNDNVSEENNTAKASDNVNKRLSDFESGQVDPKRKYEMKRVRCFKDSWVKEFPWVAFQKEKNIMICQECQAHPDIADKSSALFKGTSNFRKDALVSHNTSVKHSRCLERSLANKHGSKLSNMYERYVTKLDISAQTKMQHLFNTAFCVAKEALPFKSFEWLCNLQTKNGLDLGNSYINDKGCKSMIQSISALQTDNNKKSVLKARFISVLADGSTDSSITEQEVVYIRFVGEDGHPNTMFADLVPLQSATSPGVLQGIDKGLAAVGISLDIQKEKLIGCNFDGASIMMGSKSGVSTLLKQRIPHIISIHCVAHRLELAVLDAVKTVPYLKVFDDTVKSIFKFYFYSPKKRRELKHISSILEEDSAYYSGLQQIRWLASRHRSLKALEKHLAVTVFHLENTGSASTNQDAFVSKGILKTLKSEEFVAFLYFMLDFTEVVSQLSEAYQSEDLILSDVVLKLEKAMWGLQSIKKHIEGGNHYSSFLENYDQESCVLSSGKEKKLIIVLMKGTSTEEAVNDCFNKILNDTIKYMDTRFGNLQQPPISHFQVFDHTMWPSFSELPEFGNEDIKGLVEHFSAMLSDQEKQEALTQWADLKLRLHRQRSTKPLDVYCNLLTLCPPELSSILALVNMMVTLSHSTASCEHFFSLMNRLKTNLKTNMKQDTLRDLIQIQMSCNLDEFDAQAALSHWLSSTKTKRHVFSKSQSECSTSQSVPDPVPCSRADPDATCQVSDDDRDGD